MRRVWGIVFFLLCLSIGGCVTVNVYFPAAAVQKAADEIVGDVTGSDAPGDATRKQGSSGRVSDPRIGLGPEEVFADVDVTISTPRIMEIRQSMKTVFRQLKPYYQNGVVGESNNGFVELRDAGGLGLQERGLVSGLVSQQNKERASLYREIASANKLGPESVPEIQNIFANSWRKKSRSGWWVQSDGGVWERKP
jgi:uncharacterized protein YdbL (DUF1318 family)